MSRDADDAPTNRLAEETSPYLRLHRHNPVDWYPWGPEALERAREEDKPIFLSVGYSTCYWCHVMERESFSDPAIAELMNESFVNVKIDREERPDLDEIYMVATQLLAGQGGWPNSVFLTPKLEPYFAGTYFPPTDVHGRPGFPQVLRTMRAAWDERREDVETQAGSVADGIRHYLEERAEPSAAVPAAGVAPAALGDLERRFDPTWGGFGGAPKFPTPSNLLLLQELADSRPRAAEMLEVTLDRMARGGLYDQLGGGFHRYATDREWKVPHFEKMLYDNAWLLAIYARHAAATGSAQSARVVHETAEFLRRELTDEGGAFWSALDAETDGHEGAYYVWARDELDAALGEEDASFLAPLYGFDGPPFFEGDRYVLHLPATLEDQAKRRQSSVDALLTDVAPLRDALLAARGERPALATDDKVLADWNGMAIHGLATAGRLLETPEYVERAERAARFVLAELRGEDGVLLHSWRAGEAKVPAMLADYATMTRGLLALYDATDEATWLEAAVELTEEQIDRLEDPAGGFFVTAESPDVLVRSKEIFDGAVPGANAVALLNLLRLAERTGEEGWRERAARGLRAFGSLAEQRPSAVPALALAVWRFHGGGDEEGAQSEAGAAADPTVVTQLETGPGGTFELHLGIARGWHLYAAVPDDATATATRLEARGAVLSHLELPPGEPWQPSPEAPEVQVYRGRVTVRGRLRDVEPQARLRLTYQACDDRRCLAPESVDVPIPQ